MNFNRFFTKSKIFLYLNLGFIIGITLGRYWRLKIGIVLIIFLALLLFCLVNKKFFIFPAIFLCLCGGIFYFQSKNNPEINQNHLAYYNNQGKREFSGIITNNPYVQKGNQKIILAGESFKGKVLITTFAYPRFQYGDILKVTGKLQTPKNFSDFSYQDYLALQDVYSVCYQPAIEIIDRNQGSFFYRNVYCGKNFLEGRMNLVLPEPDASFANGLLFGSRKSIPEKLMNDFNTTGLTHIIAISGWNITIIANLLMKIFSFLPRRFSFWLVVIGLIFFTIFVGGQAAVVRAAIMGILTFWALRSGRLKSILNGVVLTATVMLLINPKIFNFDVGFQLSFLATVGILYCYPFFEKIFSRLTNFFSLRETLGVTFSAQVLVVPFIIYRFGRFSLISPLANVLILPLIPYAMLTGFLADLIAIFSNFCGKVFGFSAFLILNYVIKIIHFLAGLKFASLNLGKISQLIIVSYYLLLLGIYGIIQLRKKNNFSYEQSKTT